ncbi:DNA repair exonuclease [Rhizobium laguerreae]|uniref:metallophosphoesterase family protein n=1 Tax=Rhizobium laguerreae TaxID=1076926 RepID=UPI001478CFD0|nr:DNA repair exonuclease [Rhizobium laguerreae]NNH42954.1 DNA repair exonuclease [Rhizobium laguerreae]
MFSFLHSSDLHIGKRFGNLPEDLRGRLREARHGVIARLAAAARQHGAGVILLAGDTFDTETPTPAVLRQALGEMARNTPLRWVLLPGNHDSLLADQLWSAARGVVPDNVILATEAVPLPLGPDVILLPAPCTTRRPGRDLTEWMTGAATADGAIRIGLAHGPIQEFSEDATATNVIAPNRAALAGLDYMALGDWHGSVAVDARTYYSGAPEPDRFKHDRPGQAMVVSIAGPGAMPATTAVTTASFSWQTLQLPLLASEDGVEVLKAALPEPFARRQTLLRVALSGRARLNGRTAMISLLEQVAPEFAHLEIDTDLLGTDCESDDLETIDRAGALRDAAELLLAESLDEARSGDDRGVARQALIRLFSYCEAIDR